MARFAQGVVNPLHPRIAPQRCQCLLERGGLCDRGGKRLGHMPLPAAEQLKRYVVWRKKGTQSQQLDGCGCDMLECLKIDRRWSRHLALLLSLHTAQQRCVAVRSRSVQSPKRCEAYATMP